MDAVSLTKDIICIKFIMHFLLEDYQRRLLPLVTLQHDLSNKKQEERRIELNNNRGYVSDAGLGSLAKPEFEPIARDSNANSPTQITAALNDIPDEKSYAIPDEKSYAVALKKLNERNKSNEKDIASPEVTSGRGSRDGLRLDIDRKLLKLLGDNQIIPEQGKLLAKQIELEDYLSKNNGPLEVSGSEISPIPQSVKKISAPHSPRYVCGTSMDPADLS